MNIIRQFRNKNHVTASRHSGIKCNPASFMSHHFNNHDTLVWTGCRMQPVNGIGSNGHGRIESEWNVCSPNIVIYCLGTETTFTPAWASLAAVFWVPFPPIHTIQSRPRSWIFFNIKAGLSSEAADRRFLNGFSLEVPSIVPPRFNKPDNDFLSMVLRHCPAIPGIRYEFHKLPYRNDLSLFCKLL